MKSIGDLMQELGFSPNSSPETQKAFIKHLIHQTQPNELKTKDKIKTQASVSDVQLSFDLGDSKKVS